MNALFLKIAVIAGLALALGGCGQSGAKADQKSSQAADNQYLEKTFTSGDKGSWDKAIKARAMNQNDYIRSQAL